MTKNLKYFMCEDSKREEIVSVPGLERFKDESGNVVPFEIKVLSQKTIDEITKNGTKRTMALDRDRQPIIKGDKIIYSVEVDDDLIMRHMLVEALKYPDLKDPKLMDFYDCYDVAEMPLLVFPRPDEYLYVANMIYTALGMGRGIFGRNNEEVDDAKN